ncbi:MAG: class I SAM-dependent methyltransferase [Vicinamibacterales bacterium]
MTRFFRRVYFVLTRPRQAFAVVFQRRFSSETIAPGVVRKQYESYDDYLAHQREKLERRGTKWLADYNENYRVALRQRLAGSGVEIARSRVICLAARLGGEVRAFRDLGAFAVGVDLNPGVKNAHVMYGDFHALEFPDGAVDIVFTNSLDHVYDLARLVAEIRRLLTPGGVFISEIVVGSKDGEPWGYYDAAGWNSVDDVLAVVIAGGFELVRREPIEGGRENVILRRLP